MLFARGPICDKIACEKNGAFAPFFVMGHGAVVCVVYFFYSMMGLVTEFYYSLRWYG